MAVDSLAKHYAVLTAPERLTLVLEAMARRDGTQAGQLKDACPRRTYSAPDVAFAERYTLALDAATVACAEMQGLYGRLYALDWALRTVASCSALHDLNAEIAFLEGVGAAAGEQGGPTDEEVAPSLAAVAERSQASTASIVALLARAGRDTARELAVVWAAFARLRLGVAPDTLLAARGLPAGDQIKRLVAEYWRPLHPTRPAWRRTSRYSRSGGTGGWGKEMYAMVIDPFARHYRALTAPERLTLVLEAMARRDDVDADRLEDSCPVLTYRGDDVEFRDRMRRAHVIALHVCLNMRAGLAQLRLAATFRQECRSFAAAGPVAVARAVFMAGRAYGRQEALGDAEAAPVPSREQVRAEIEQNAELAGQLREVREAAAEGVERVADRLLDLTIELHGADLLAQWHGFGRFCREKLSLEPGVVFAAFGLEPHDVEAEVLSRCPGAVADETEVAEVAGRWTRSWDRRFK